MTENPYVKELVTNEYKILYLGYYNGKHLDFFPSELQYDDTDMFDYTYIFLEKDNTLYKFSICENYINKKYDIKLSTVTDIKAEEYTFLRAFATVDTYFDLDKFYSMLASLRCFIRDCNLNLIIDVDSITKSHKYLNQLLTKTDS